jgi:L-alanine-DL-glutamate epimerase-like enolase superfamily enzyme
VKITHVEVSTVAVAAPSPSFKWRKGLPGSGPSGERGVLRIGTDSGASGVAFASRPGSAVVLRELVDRVWRDMLVGQDPLQRELLYHRMWEMDRIEEFALPYLGLVDLALWDLAARSVELPLWQLLGGARTTIPVYASTTTYDCTEEFLAVADRALELGYPAIKLHAWGDARRDAALCQALRDHVGADIPLMYDGSAGFDLPDAISVGHALADAGYLWYEEPMREFSLSAYAELARAVRVPLLSAETSDGSFMNSADFIKAGAATFGVRISSELRGGISGALRTAHVADAFHVRAEPHGMGEAEQHLCMAIQNATYFEILVTHPGFERWDGVDTEGNLHAPVGPGVSLPRGLDYPAELQEYVNPAPVAAPASAPVPVG